jgi:predicted transcriptional regulator
MRDSNMKPPCMIVVQHILPALRVAIAKELVYNYKLKKTDVSELMGLTPAAITQYLNRSRGENAKILEDSSEVNNLIKEIAQDMVEGESPPDMLLLKMCRICHVVRTEGLICDLHMKAMPKLRSVQPCACSFGITQIIEPNNS